MKKSIDAEIRSRSFKSIDELEDLLKKICTMPYEILLCYEQGYYQGVKISLKFSDTIKRLIPAGGIYGSNIVPLAGTIDNKRVILLKEKSKK